MALECVCVWLSVCVRDREWARERGIASGGMHPVALTNPPSPPPPPPPPSPHPSYTHVPQTPQYNILCILQNFYWRGNSLLLSLILLLLLYAPLFASFLLSSSRLCVCLCVFICAQDKCSVCACSLCCLCVSACQVCVCVNALACLWMDGCVPEVGAEALLGCLGSQTGYQAGSVCVWKAFKKYLFCCLLLLCK